MPKELFEDLDEKSQKICQAAVEIFSKKSFNKTTVSEIATKAEVGKGTFYLYFDSKSDLLNFLLDHGIEKLISQVSDKIDEDNSPSENLENAIDAQLKFFNKYHNYCNFFIREIWSYRKSLKREVKKLKENYIVIFENIIEEGIKDGSFKDIDTETISSGLFGFSSISSIHWILFSQEFPVVDINESIKKVFFEGLLKES